MPASSGGLGANRNLSELGKDGRTAQRKMYVARGRKLYQGEKRRAGSASRHAQYANAKQNGREPLDPGAIKAAKKKAAAAAFLEQQALYANMYDNEDDEEDEAGDGGAEHGGAESAGAVGAEQQAGGGAAAGPSAFSGSRFTPTLTNSAPPLAKSLLELVQRKVEETPSAIAVQAPVPAKGGWRGGGGAGAGEGSRSVPETAETSITITYAELDARACRIAAALAVEIAAHEASASVAVVRERCVYPLNAPHSP